MDKLLPQAHSKMLTNLVELKEVCEKNNINFWLDSGTLLGAVRSNSFIPWDDDVDICMPRKDFNAFLRLASSQQLSSNFFVQTIHSDPYYNNWQIPCKIRVNNTLIIEKVAHNNNTFEPNCHNGLFIDILPIDISPQSYFFEFFIRLLKICYTAKFLNTNRGNKTLRRFINYISQLVPLVFLEFIKNTLVKRFNGQYYIYGIELPFKRRYFEKSDIFPLSKIIFEGHEFSCPNDTHAYLTKLYGSNYMQTPPLDKRVSHYHKIEIY